MSGWLEEPFQAAMMAQIHEALIAGDFNRKVILPRQDFSVPQRLSIHETLVLVGSSLDLESEVFFEEHEISERSWGSTPEQVQEANRNLSHYTLLHIPSSHIEGRSLGHLLYDAAFTAQRVVKDESSKPNTYRSFGLAYSIGDVFGDDKIRGLGELEDDFREVYAIISHLEGRFNSHIPELRVPIPREGRLDALRSRLDPTRLRGQGAYELTVSSIRNQAGRSVDILGRVRDALFEKYPTQEHVQAQPLVAGIKH